jgi:NAD-dependent histone deacetylase SIR2
MHEAIEKKEVPHCLDASCNGLVKPKIVFFGEQLPSEFFDNHSLPSEADLCIVMGTSLSVHPFAGLPQICRRDTPRVLINSERVGDMGGRPDDVLMIESCDSGVRKLAEACGWLQELEELWAKTARDEKPAAPPKDEVKKSRDELLEDEVDKLTREVDESLRLGKAQHEWLDKHVDKKIARKPDDEKDKESLAASLEPTDDPDSKVLAPVSNPGTTKTDPGGGLGHVFPHMKKPSL